MEPLIPIKKKLRKRKSRRCNELRKKSHQINECSKARKTKSGCLKGGNYITLTSDRLTLCNKAIQSETITRNQHCETGCSSSKDLSNVNSIIRGKLRINLIPHKTKKSHEYLRNKVMLSESDTIDDDNKIKNHVKDCGVHRLTNYQTPVNIVSCSIGHEDAINVELNSPERVSLISSSSCLNNNTVKDIFDDFIDELNECIEDLSPELYKLDFLNKMLDNIYNCKTKSNEEPVIEDLFKRNYASTKNDPVLEQMLLTINPLTHHTSKDCKEVSKPNMSYSLEVSVSNLATNITSESSGTQSSFHSTTILDDSPEYSYYPHKLN